MTLLFSPFPGVVYILFDPSSISVKWEWSTIMLVPSVLVGFVYGLRGPTTKPHRSISYSKLKQLILAISSIGFVLLILAMIDIAATDNGQFVAYYSVGLVIYGYILTLMQLIRLKQQDWLAQILVGTAFFFPIILFVGIVYGINGPVSLPPKPPVLNKPTSAKKINTTSNRRKK